MSWIGIGNGNGVHWVGSRWSGVVRVWWWVHDDDGAGAGLGGGVHGIVCGF